MGVLRGAARPSGQAEPRPVWPSRAASGRAGLTGQRGGCRLRSLDRVAHLPPCGPQGKIAIGQGAYRKQRSIKPNLCRVFKEENGNV